MSNAVPIALIDRRQRLEALQRRVRGRLGRPAASVKVSRSGEVALLRGFSAEELREFARGCHAQVVSRVGGEEFDFSFAGPADSLDS